MPAASSSSPQGTPSLGPGEFEQIRKLAHRACGLDLRAGKEELVSSRLLRLVSGSGYGSFHEYYRGVVEDKTGIALANMIDALTTNHTSFLREPEQFAFLRQHAEELARGRSALDIWSAACSTGEEVWSLACLFADILPDLTTRVWGTDISNKALRIAEEAVYTADRCADLPPAWLTRYFEPEGGAVRRYRASPALRARAVFRRMNLIERLNWTQPFPIIFCRNVMIYFDRPTQEALVLRLEQVLEPGGYLFIGQAESLTRVSHSLEYVQPAVFRRPRAKGGRWRPSW